jgi:hypothetical protein
MSEIEERQQLGMRPAALAVQFPNKKTAQFQLISKGDKGFQKFYLQGRFGQLRPIRLQRSVNTIFDVSKISAAMDSNCPKNSDKLSGANLQPFATGFARRTSH